MVNCGTRIVSGLPVVIVVHRYSRTFYYFLKSRGFKVQSVLYVYIFAFIIPVITVNVIERLYIYIHFTRFMIVNSKVVMMVGLNIRWSWLLVKNRDTILPIIELRYSQ